MSRCARVLYLAPDPALTLDQQGGAGTHMRGTIDALRRQGFEVEVAVGGLPGDVARPTVAQRPAPALARSLPEPLRLLARDLRLLVHGRAFRRATFADTDVVYERSAYLLDVGRLVAQRRDVPYLIETDGILVGERAAAYGAALRRAGERLERLKIRQADLVVVMSEASCQDISLRYGVPSERLLVKGLGVERELFQADAALEPRVDVGWSGTFQPYHGVELLVEALRRLDGRSALLVGDGPRHPAVAAATRGLAVEMTGLLPRSEGLRRLAECRVLVVPESADFVYPVKLLEYASLGRPVVCPRRPAFDEFRRDGEELIFGFRPGDPVDLARAIDEATDAASCARAKQLRELVARDYTWDAVGARLAEGIRRVLADGRVQCHD